MPDIRNNSDYMNVFSNTVFRDTFLIPYCLQDNYSADILRVMDIYMNEGPYGYQDTQKNFDVTIHQGDIVIDAGAWIGDFSAYAASKGARVFAFEPSTKNFQCLERTAALNRPKEINAFNAALADSCTEMQLFHGNDTAGHYLKISDREESATSEAITTITLDDFVHQQHLERVDFIKADIEGAERRLLAGARETLRNFAPKLALCTYHLPDDPEVLEQMILEMNPEYKVIQLRKKLFACVPHKH